MSEYIIPALSGSPWQPRNTEGELYDLQNLVLWYPLRPESQPEEEGTAPRTVGIHPQIETSTPKADSSFGDDSEGRRSARDRTQRYER